ncbi:MAG: cytochrome P450 [Gammaproteobacteria bacterium]|nr:cytochrome P450 [Gammaproteobacteria bacterium]
MAQAPQHFNLLDPAVIAEPYPFYRSLLEHAPVYRIPGTEVFFVAGWQLIHQVLRNQQDFSANLSGILITGDNGAPALFDLTQFGSTVDALANADEPWHAVHRKLVLPQLNARKVTAMEPEVRTWVRQRVQQLVGAGGGDAVEVLANPIPVMVMARLAGLPVTDVDQLLQWAFSGGDILAGTATLDGMLELAASTAELAQYLKQHFARVSHAMADPPNCVIHELVLGVQRGLIDEAAAIAILIVLVGAAGESTSSLAGSALRLLAENTALQAQLRAQPAQIEAFVEEVVRLESPFKGHYRVVLNACELGGVCLPAGSRVFLLWAAANRDPTVFQAPDEIQPGRADGREHLGFGHGMHFCIGARLARLEVRLMLEEILAATTGFTLDPAIAPLHTQSIFVRRLDSLMLRVAASKTYRATD